MSNELLEEIRLLANCETESEKLLPLVLAAQPELRDRLNETELRQLKQRVTLRCEIRPFKVEETATYIATRIRTAGGNATKIFTREAVMLIHERSGGIPRTISVICDNALVTGFGLGRQPIDREVVADVVRDFDLGSISAREPAIDLADHAIRGVDGTPAQDESPEIVPAAVDEESMGTDPPKRLFSMFRVR
jgi:general secretion pathway protein A